MKFDFMPPLLAMSLFVMFSICLIDSVSAETTDNKQWKNFFLEKSINNNVPKSEQLFKFQFMASNGTIDKLTQDSQSEGITANVNSQDNATLEIKFPRNYPFVQGYNNASEHYAPIIYFSTNHLESKYAVNTSDCFFVYAIPFSGNSEVDMVIAHAPMSNLPDAYHGDNISPSCNRQTTVSYMPPLEQITAGVDPKDVTCVSGFVTVLHPVSNMPSCVKPDTLGALIERGWAKPA